MYIENIKNLTLSKVQLIKNNAASGAGIYFHCSDELTSCDIHLLESVEIKGNSASIQGGGIYFD